MDPTTQPLSQAAATPWAAGIGGIAGLVVAGATATFQRRAAGTAWRRARDEVLIEQLRLNLDRFTTELSQHLYAMMDAAWSAKHADEDITRDAFKAYTARAFEYEQKLTASLAIIAAVDAEACSKLRKSYNNALELDGRVQTAFAANDRAALAELLDDAFKSLGEVPDQLKNVMTDAVHRLMRSVP